MNQAAGLASGSRPRRLSDLESFYGILKLPALFEQPSDRTMGQFVCRGEPQFFLDVGLMGFDSLDTQGQMFGHFAHRHALAYQVKNL